MDDRRVRVFDAEEKPEIDSKFISRMEGIDSKNNPLVINIENT